MLVSIGIIIVSMIVIWKGCDTFEESTSYIGRNLSDGVKGATLNAIGSSLPELFAASLALLFYVNKEGFAFGVGTTAGSAVFNSAVIPALVLITVTFFGAVKYIKVSKKVILRDGLFLILGEFLLILILTKKEIGYKDGAALLLWYYLYIFYMFKTMKKEQVLVEKGSKLKLKTAWIKLLISVSFIGVSCYWLVEACYNIGDILGIKTYFVAVILAAAATSIPDTIISLKDARKGDYDDAVANALGSNIFDICVCLGLPIFLYCIITGDTIKITQAKEIAELRIALLGITIFVFFNFLFLKLNAFVGFLLMATYGLFILYVADKVYNLGVLEWFQCLCQ